MYRIVYNVRVPKRLANEKDMIQQGTRLAFMIFEEPTASSGRSQTFNIADHEQFYKNIQKTVARRF